MSVQSPYRFLSCLYHFQIVSNSLFATHHSVHLFLVNVQQSKGDETWQQQTPISTNTVITAVCLICRRCDKKKKKKNQTVDESSNGSTPHQRNSVRRSYFGKPIKVYRQPNIALLFSFRARERRRRQPRKGCRDTSSSHLICNLHEATTFDSCARVRDKVWCHQPKYLRGVDEEVPGRRRRRTCVSLLLLSFTRASVTAAECERRRSQVSLSLDGL